jgi:hypothetical protein
MLLIRSLHSAILPLIAAQLLATAIGCSSSTPSPPTSESEPGRADPLDAEQAISEPAPEEELSSPSADDSVISTAGEPLPAGTLDEADWSDGWISLFDGSTMFGWEVGSEANWQVEDGTLVVSEGEQGLLCTTARFDNYELTLEFNADPETNSGIFLRTPLRPTDPQTDCYELNIAPADNPFPTGSLVGRKRIEGDPQGSGWQRFDVTVDGSRITAMLDGQPVIDYDDPQPLERGRIGLQLNEGRVAFRNIRLKPLGLEGIFNGHDLEGWREYPDMESRFFVTEEGHLRVQDGSGQLETREEYGNFILQLECITHAPHLNSGIFFRCIPGERMNGYESQIHNGFEGQDRTRPLDFGTGAIFRRAAVRVVAANDQQWFAKTIIADGPHLAVWVNGLQVTDWTDTREPHENPRQGLRVEPGTIMIQGHDPTTDLSFRNLRIAELQ